MKKWFPWINVVGEVPVATNSGEPIDEPPCKKCRHWNPQVCFQNGPEGQIPAGVRLCHAVRMHHDFSCFSMREEELQGSSTQKT